MRALFRKYNASDLTKLGFFFFMLFGTTLIFVLTPDLFPSALLSMLFFFVFSPIVDAFERKGISRSQGILAIFLICGAFIAVTMSTAIPRIAQEVESFQRASSDPSSFFMTKLKAQEAALTVSYPYFENLKIAEKGLASIQSATDKAIALAPKIATQLLICVFLVPFLTFILLKDAHEIRRQLLRLVPNRHFETVYSLTSRMLDKMGGYVSARILEAAIVTVLVTLGCIICKIPYALLIGFFAGATNPIPYLGPLIGAVPGIAMAILAPAIASHLVWITAIYIVANLIDMVVIFPLVVAKIVDLHPVIVIISVLLGSQLFGVVGMIVAVPITSILKILVQEIYTKIYGESEGALR